MIWQTAEELNKEIAKNIRIIRKRKKITQEELAIKSNVSYGSIKRFETTGNISLISLTRICMVLGCEDQLRSLFKDVPYENIEEVLNERK